VVSGISFFPFVRPDQPQFSEGTEFESADPEPRRNPSSQNLEDPLGFGLSPTGFSGFPANRAMDVDGRVVPTRLLQTLFRFLLNGGFTR
jgi:hypothetical protein